MLYRCNVVFDNPSVKDECKAIYEFIWIQPNFIIYRYEKTVERIRGIRNFLSHSVSLYLYTTYFNDIRL